MINYDEMKRDVAGAIRAATERGSRKDVVKAVATYLDHVAEHIYGTPAEINGALADAIDAGLVTAEEVVQAHSRATERLVTGVFGESGGRETGTARLAARILPHVPGDALVEALGLRWSLQRWSIAERALPFLSGHRDEGKARRREIRAAASAMLSDMAEGAGSDATADMLARVLEIVNGSLEGMIEFVLDPTAPDIAAAARRVAEENDPALYASLPSAILDRVFGQEAWIVGAARREMRCRAPNAIAEFLGELSTELSRQFGVEKPIFLDWAGTAKGQEVLEGLRQDGMEVLSGVVEDDGVEKTLPFIIFEGWPQLQTLERYVDMDSLAHGFSDEYSRCQCGSCDVAVRTRADSWAWQPVYIQTDHGVVLLDHAADDEIEAYVAERVNNAENAVNCQGLDLTRLGFRKLCDDYDAGHEPTLVLMALRKRAPRAEFVFCIDATAQFDLNFSVWVRGEYEG